MEFIDKKNYLSCTSLLNAAQPDVYLKNAFRITGLSVEATPREISRYGEKIRMMNKLGSNAPLSGPLPLIPPPDEYTISEAIYKLNDPEKRLIDEFFWFWPNQLGQGKTDEIMILLDQNNTEKALERLLTLETMSENYVSKHNLAVLNHCLALDLEITASKRSLNENEKAKLTKNWDETHKRWKEIIQHEAFWSRLSARIQHLEDPRLTTGLARRMKETLPLALLLINSVLAVRYAEKGDMASAQRQLEIMRRWENPTIINQSGPLVLEALGSTLAPLRQRIKTLCQKLETKADADPAHADQATEELLQNTSPLLGVFDFLLSPRNPVREAVHDEVANFGILCSIPYAKKTENWKVVLGHLLKLSEIAVGKNLQNSIQENINTVKRNIEYDTCWFCKENTSTNYSELKVEMHGNIRRTPAGYNRVHVEWNHRTLRVPRCPSCKIIHSKMNMVAVMGILGVVLGITSCMALSQNTDSSTAGGWMFFILSIIGFGIGKFMQEKRHKGTMFESFKENYPIVRELLREGWSYGEKPSSQS